MKYIAFMCFLTLISCTTIKNKQCICDTGSWDNKSKSCLLQDDVVCTAEYKPVCGCDGVQYSNACAANKAGVKYFSFGECE